ncbi:MAG TPA: FHA domain-containing protein [Propionibacteriaceae bacterium]|nr:FHA domain-containing protein [Propionibacteriaceae bacterium]
MAQTSTQREMTMAAPMGQWRATYAPGTSLILAGPTSLVLLREPGTAQERLVNALWEQVMRSATMGELAARLAVFSIDKLPGFAALFWTSKGMRSLVRGDVTVTDPSSGNVVASGSDIQTWSESGLGNLTRVSVITGEEAEPGPVLPLVVGVAYASWVCLDASADAQVRSPQEIPEEEFEYTSPVSLAAASRNPAASSTSPVVLSVSQDRSSTAAAAPAGDLAAAPAAPAEGPPVGSAAPSAPAEGPPMDSSAQVVPAETAPMSSTVEGLPDPPTEPFEAGPLSTTSEDPWGSDDDGPDTEPMPAVEDGDEQPLQVGLAVDRSTDSREADLESKSAGVSDDILEADTQLMEVPIEHPAFNPQLYERQQAAATQAAMPPPVAADVDDTPPTLPLSSSPRAPLAQDPSTESLIMAADCPHGHSNPPAAATCRMCGAAIAPQRPRLIHRPVLCVLQASDGTTADVDRAVLVGRAPDPDRSNFKAPRLMSVQSPGHDISRTHVEVAPKGWQVIAIDLNSTNGTVLIRPGGNERQQLAPGEHVPVQPGSVLDLGDGVSITVALPS